jgi:putative SOS response-associated peptidase YedK
MRWGLVPWWAKDQSIGNKLINARAETLTEKASFKRLLGLRRCLVPANAFYEWRKEGKQKTPMLIRLKGDETFAFAGLWETWRKPDGNLLESFTIITCAPNELTKTIHDRVVRVLSRHRRSPFRSATFA